ncbi:MAG: DUF6326 family protein [Nostocoides sp.]
MGTHTTHSNEARLGTTASPALISTAVVVQAKLAAAWASFSLLYAYVDILHFYKPGTITDILAGKVFTFDISQTFAAAALASVAIPILMITASMTLPARANRITNLIMASVQIPYAAFNVAGGEWTYFYGLGVVLEVFLLLFILRYAWTWPRTRPASTAVAA